MNESMSLNEMKDIVPLVRWVGENRFWRVRSSLADKNGSQRDAVESGWIQVSRHTNGYRWKIGITEREVVFMRFMETVCPCDFQEQKGQKRKPLISDSNKQRLTTFSVCYSNMGFLFTSLLSL